MPVEVVFAGSDAAMSDEQVARAERNVVMLPMTAGLPENLRLFIPDPESPDAYPIVTPSWLLAKRRYELGGSAEAVKAFVRHGLSENSQREAQELGYVPLPGAMRQAATAAVSQIE